MLAFKIARIKKGYTQEKLSEVSNVGRATISKIEVHGIETVPVKTLEKLAKALDMTITELFFADVEGD